MDSSAQLPAATRADTGADDASRNHLAALQVLVVDDDEVQREAVANILHALGARRVVEARCGRDGLVALQHMAADVIVCDLDMRAAGAVEFLRAVAQRKLCRQIVISGREADIVASVEAMAQAYGLVALGKLNKPVTPAALRQALAPTPEGRHLATRRLRSISEQDLRHALRQREFHTLYQPKVDMRTRSLVAVEALARWTSRGATLAHPTDFLPALTRHGLVAALTDVVIEDTCGALATWRSHGLGPGMAINVPVTALADLGFVERLAAQIAPHGLAPSRFTLEVTETDMVADVARTLDVMSRLRLKGFRLALDDFGTGYSSLRQLMMTPLTELKVDGAFVQDCLVSSRARDIVRSSIELAHRIGVTVVAEGIETQEQWALLASMGCDQAQGYFIGTPLSAAELPRWADAWACRGQGPAQGALL
jgi:EAL domain-containing protein (putative c-di-GMP-specific phosphodiesterase class I)/CheY-like chemotaxis protein